MTYKDAVEDILFSKEDYYRIKRGIDFMLEVYTNETGITASNLTNEQMIETENGLVVTPVHAAHCLIDLMRTTQFLRGIHQAILSYSAKKNDRPVKILYAGCGPYATLLTPFTELFSSNEVSFTLLDFNPVSIEAVRNMYKSWGIEQYVTDYLVEDATSTDLNIDSDFDIIISETMQAVLKNECQVPLTRNMVRFLSPEGTFIPQNITVDAYLVGPNDPESNSKPERVHVGSMYDLDYRKVPEVNHQVELPIPEHSFEYLYLFTEIRVFEDEIIKPYASGLTMPLISDRFVEKPKAITFKYLETEKPDFVQEYHF